MKARDFVAPRPVKSAISFPSSLASAACSAPPDRRSLACDMAASHPSLSVVRSTRAERESTRAKRCRQPAYRCGALTISAGRAQGGVELGQVTRSRDLVEERSVEAV